MLRLIFAAGMSGNDDLSIAAIAHRIQDHGFFLPTMHYEARIGLTVPLSILFRIFGTGIPQLIAMPMIASLIGMFVAYRLGTLMFDGRVGLLAAGALAFYPLDAEYAGLFFPDLIQGVTLATAFLLALSSRSSKHENLVAVAAGICWAYAYYVKIDAFFMGVVFLLATVMGAIGWRAFIVICATALLLVGVELVAYGILTGNPLYHAELEHRAANEVLAPHMDYRNLLSYPKSMFLTVYETGIHFYLLLAAIILAVARRSRPALLLAGWVVIFLFWLTFGIDPLDGGFRAKAQLARYLLDFAVPMSVLIGWVVLWGYTRVSKGLTIAACAFGVAIAILFMAFNVLSYEPAQATRIAATTALRENYLPLYVDAQSDNIVAFMMHDRTERDSVHVVQHHDFLTGITTFDSITEPKAYLLINEDFARRLEKRNLVKPIDPAQFGRAEQILSIDNPMPDSAYTILRGLNKVAGFVPIGAIRDHINDTTEEVMRTGDAKIYRIEH